jgi:hypothetical protein
MLSGSSDAVVSGEKKIKKKFTKISSVKFLNAELKQRVLVICKTSFQIPGLILYRNIKLATTH